MMETFLITGGAGFIGSNFIKFLFGKRDDIKVVNVDKLTYAGNLDNLETFKENRNHVFVKEDICIKKNVGRIFHQYRPDYVINFAAETHVDRSINDSEDFVRTNVLGTQLLLDLSLRYDIKRYIQISTDEVYGSGEPVGYFTEDSPTKPGNPYAASKAAADMLALSFYNTYKLPVIVTRCTNNYGPGQHSEKLIPLIIKHCLEGVKIPMYGDGRNIRDWIHVYDHCEAVYKILQKGDAGQIYNISAYNEKENIEVARMVINEMGVLLHTGGNRRNMIGTELIEFVEDRKGHDRRYAVSSEKLRNSLGWRPLQDFGQSLQRTIKWYVDKNSAGGQLI